MENSREDSRDVHFFRDHVLEYMLFFCAGELRPETMFSQGFRALIEHDRRKSVEYIKKLDIYLQNEMSITKTAQALFIYRSSLIKHLEHIQRLLGDDLTDPWLYYRICLALLRKIKNSIQFRTFPKEERIRHLSSSLNTKKR